MTGQFATADPTLCGFNFQFLPTGKPKAGVAAASQKKPRASQASAKEPTIYIAGGTKESPWGGGLGARGGKGSRGPYKNKASKLQAASASSSAAGEVGVDSGGGVEVTAAGAVEVTRLTLELAAKVEAAKMAEEEVKRLRGELMGEMRKAVSADAKAEAQKEQLVAMREELNRANASASESWRKGYAEGLAAGKKDALRAVHRHMNE